MLYVQVDIVESRASRGEEAHSGTSGTAKFQHISMASLIARFMGPTWGPAGADRTQVGPMLATWTMLSGLVQDRSSNGDCSFALSRRYAIYKFVETSGRTLIFLKFVYASFTYLTQIKFAKSTKGASYANAMRQNLYSKVTFCRECITVVVIFATIYIIRKILGGGF